MNFAISRSDVKMMRLLLGQDPYREQRVIEIRLTEQQARMYDNQGNEIFTTKISTGRQGFSTRTGEFVITNKYRDWTSTIYHASMPYFQRLSCSDFGMHQGYVPGYPASHGCIRVPVGNAAKLFSLTQVGDRVTILP
jgi:lipoprotein-anchoring transpeptidase ErfK/SrfK